MLAQTPLRSGCDEGVALLGIVLVCLLVTVLDIVYNSAPCGQLKILINEKLICS